MYTYVNVINYQLDFVSAVILFCAIFPIILLLELDTSKAMLETGRYKQQKLGSEIEQQLLDHLQPENQWIYPFGKLTSLWKINILIGRSAISMGHVQKLLKLPESV